MNKYDKIISDISKAGTGFMIGLTDTIQELEAEGYVENLVPRFDHFECRSSKILIYPNEIEVDKVIRLENTSDPDDQAIVFAISIPKKNLKGLYVDSYGTYHDDLSKDILDRLAVEAKNPEYPNATSP